MGIPIQRILEKMDTLLARKETEAAERHLDYWIAEAEQTGDHSGKLTLLNERIGFYRKQGRGGEAIAAAQQSLQLAESLGLAQTVTMGTTLVNAATAYKAFGDAGAALPLYERARTIYEAKLPAGDARLGGLYNNMALTMTELGDYGRAEDLFRAALGVMEQMRGGEADMAITYCNLADLASAQLGAEAGEEQITADLERAIALLDSKMLPRDGYYAFVCEKCAPTFAHYGFFYYEQVLSARAEEITAQLRAD